jgi:hypothetical protein
MHSPQSVHRIGLYNIYWAGIHPIKIYRVIAGTEVTHSRCFIRMLFINWRLPEQKASDLRTLYPCISLPSSFKKEAKAYQNLILWFFPNLIWEGYAVRSHACRWLLNFPSKRVCTAFVNLWSYAPRGLHTQTRVHAQQQDGMGVISPSVLDFTSPCSRPRISSFSAVTFTLELRTPPVPRVGRMEIR